MAQKTSGLNNTSRHGLEPGPWTDLDHGNRHRERDAIRRASHQRGRAGTTGEGDYKH